MKLVFFSTVFIGLLCYVTCGTCRNKKRQNMKQTQLQWNGFSSNENERSGSIIKNPVVPPTSNDDIFGKIPQLLQKKIQDPSFVSYNGDTGIGGIPYNVGRLQKYNNGDSLGLHELQDGKKRLVNKLVRPNKGLKGTDRSLISQIGVPKEGRLGVLQGDNRGLVGISGNVDVLQNGNRPLKRIIGEYNRNQRKFGVLKGLNISLGYKKEDLAGSGIFGSDVEIIGVDNSTSDKDFKMNKFNKDGIRILGDDQSRMKGDSDGPWTLGDNTYNMRDSSGLSILGDDTRRLRGDNDGSNTPGENTASMNNNGGFNTFGGDTTIMEGNNGELRTLGDNSDSMKDSGGLRIFGDNTYNRRDEGGLRILGDDTSKLREDTIGSNTPGDNTASMNNNGELRTLGDNTYSIRYNGVPGDDTSGMNSQSDGFRPFDYYNSYNGVSGINDSNMNYDYMSSEEDDDDVLSLLDYGKTHKKRDNNRR